MRNLFLKYLDEHHISYDASNPSVVSFTYRELNFLMIYDSNDDPNYIRFCLPDVEPSAIDDSIREKMLRINSLFKVAKVIEMNHQVWITGESFIYNYVSVQSLFDRMLSLLYNVITEYRQQ